MILIRCSYPKCSHSVASASVLLALDLAERSGYWEDGRDGRIYCGEHAASATNVGQWNAPGGAAGGHGARGEPGTGPHEPTETAAGRPEEG